MREIPLTQGKVAIVDDIDYDFLMQFTWRAIPGRAATEYRAARNLPRDEAGKRPSVYMHRDVAKRAGILAPIMDHIDHDPLNNRRSNLRPATNSQNLHNRNHDRNNTSGYPGVYYVKARGNYIAKIGYGGTQIYLGTFDDPGVAYRVRCAKKRELAGKFAPEEIKDA